MTTSPNPAPNPTSAQPSSSPATAPELVGLGEIEAAAARLAGPVGHAGPDTGDAGHPGHAGHAGGAGHIVHTPMLPVRPVLPGGDARPFWVKPESLQRIGAFKIRGALNAVAALDPAARGKGIVTSSSGNHGQAVAYAAAVHGIRATVVIPEGSAGHKVDAVRALGAEVRLVGPDQRDTTAAEIADTTGAALIPPYDHRDIIAGQGTVGLELVAGLPDVRTVLVQVGGGGLIAGVATAVKAMAPGARVIGVEPELAADLAESRSAGERVSWSTERTFRTIADGVRTPSVGVLPWAHIQAYVDDIVTVTEQQIIEAVGVLAQRARLVAEPSGAVSTAAFLAYADRLPDGPVAAIVSGGNVDPGLLAHAMSAGVESRTW